MFCNRSDREELPAYMTSGHVEYCLVSCGEWRLGSLCWKDQKECKCSEIESESCSGRWSSAVCVCIGGSLSRDVMKASHVLELRVGPQRTALSGGMEAITGTEGPQTPTERSGPRKECTQFSVRLNYFRMRTKSVRLVFLFLGVFFLFLLGTNTEAYLIQITHFKFQISSHKNTTAN